MVKKIEKKSTAVVTVASAEALAELQASFPVEQGFTRTFLPRLGMYSQDVVDGKGKTMKVTTEAGEFYIERQEEEENDKGEMEKVWKRKEIGNEIEAIIIFQRKQLKYYDEKTETYTSSPVYDTEDEIIPLFLNKAEIARGTPAELKARKEYQFEKDGKTKSKLEDNRILYVLYKDEVYQMNLRGSSMYSWMGYARKVLPPSVLTGMNSEAKEKGTIAWNQMTFEKVRDLNQKELNAVLAKVAEIKDAVKTEKSFYASVAASSDAAKKELEKF